MAMAQQGALVNATLKADMSLKQRSKGKSDAWCKFNKVASYNTANCWMLKKQKKKERKRKERANQKQKQTVLAMIQTLIIKTPMEWTAMWQVGQWNIQIQNLLMFLKH